MDVRPSPIAGKWYPLNATELRCDLDRFLEQAPVADALQNVCGLIVPHAGIRYSGPVAAHAFRQAVRCVPQVVVIIGPMHRPQAPLTTSAHDAYQTPLGNIPLDRNRLQELDRCLRTRLGIGLIPIERDQEHSLEMELPFLQRVLDQFSLMPIMMADQSRKVAEALGHALAEVIGNTPVLLVASTDLSHFYSQADALNLDSEMLRRIERFDPCAVLEAEDAGKAFACGRGAVAAVLWAARDLGANRVSILNYSTSGDVTGDTHSVVGYGAAAVWQDQQANTDHRFVSV